MWSVERDEGRDAFKEGGRHKEEPHLICCHISFRQQIKTFGPDKAKVQEMQKRQDNYLYSNSSCFTGPSGEATLIRSVKENIKGGHRQKTTSWKTPHLEVRGFQATAAVVVCCIFHGALLKLSLHFPPALQRSRLQHCVSSSPPPPVHHDFLHLLATLTDVSLMLYSLCSPLFSGSFAVCGDFSRIKWKSNENQNESNWNQIKCNAWWPSAKFRRSTKRGSLPDLHDKGQIKTEIRGGYTVMSACGWV